MDAKLQTPMITSFITFLEPLEVKMNILKYKLVND